MTADQYNRLIGHAKSLLADPKWLKTATPEAYRWATFWAARLPSKVAA